ncbi:pH-response transcription factor pacC/RIM101-like protein [Elsinoe fawcettii]|nr:pH-response transcription factor pacC/RIM101-like protein [Elsinoe fawcettii]
MAAEEVQAQPAPATTTSTTESSIQQLPAQPTRDPAAETLTCQWVGCGERCPNAEQLYEHVCERHVGRKSTNNLNLTCQWGACRTTTVKRDHITSHMRVHVPLKPHKCEFCGKSFKRPQDLKKHVKTHADDSVLLRSPESNMNNNQNGQNGFPADNKAYYPGHDVNGAYPPAAGHNIGGSNFNSYPNPPAYSGYGQVNYPGTSLADQQSMDTRRRAIEALNDFLGDVKRRALDPHSYYDVGSRLNTQSLPLPVSIGAGYSIGNGYNGSGNGNGHANNFGSVNSMLESFSGSSGGVSMNNGGGAVAHGALAQNYQLPLSNARTKGDLLDIDRFLEQLSATVYESSGQSAAAGVQQPGVHTQLPGYNFNNYHRSSHSPPQAQHSGSVSSTSSVQPLSSVAQMASMTASAQGMDTPALTPASVSSYASSGHSPMSSHSRSSGDGSSMYPQLPSVTTMSDMGSGYSSAPASGLASGFDGYDSRRYSGGRLQREAPARRGSDAMDIDSEGQRTPRKMSITEKRPTSSSNVDPALRSTPPGESPAGSSPQSESADDKAQEAWVENVRVIEQLRNWIRDRLSAGEFEKDADSTPEPADHQMSKEESVEETREQQEEEDAPIAYPTLKMEA